MTQPVEYVGFWARFLATLIDTVALGLLLLPLVWMFGLGDAELNLSFIQGANPPDVPAVPVMSADSWLQWLLYAGLVIGFWTVKSATPGKMIIGAVIVDEKTGEVPSLGQWIIRYFGYLLSTLLLFLGFIWIAFDARKQGWHDKLAGTLVIRKPA